MSDNLQKTRPQDASRINIHEAWEVRWWCSEFGCTAEELKQAVEQAGTSAAAVKSYLKR